MMRSSPATIHAVGWSDRDPSPGYQELRDHFAFYRVDGGWIDDERVRAQQRGFHGGWITSDLVGPFMRPPGTVAW